jgi:putative YphP/YqiW family bacilliredoxin
MRDGNVVFMLERRDIESRDAYSIADALTQAFDRFCTPTNAGPSQ